MQGVPLVLLPILQFTLLVGIVWSSCDIASFSSINATVNTTILIECKANCTPIRLLTKQGTGPEIEIRPYTDVPPDSNDAYYGVKADLFLNASLHNAILICRTFEDRLYTKTSRILLQESLQSVKHLTITESNATHTTISWSRPPAVLDGIQIMYSVQLYQENNICYNRTVTETFVSVRSICPPCCPSYFSVTPVAEQLRGETEEIFNKASCIEGHQITMTMMNSTSFSKNYTENSVQIAFKIKIHEKGCMPFIAIMTAFCHHSKTSKNHTIRNLTDDEPTTASLPAHDTCSVSLIPEYSNGYSPPSLQKPFNLSLFDTESITTDTISTSRSLCVTCYFAPWTIENTTCTILIHILETSNKSSLNIHKNSSTGKGRECISKLPTDKEYIVNIAVVEDQTIHVHPVNISINFTSSDSSTGDTEGNHQAIVIPLVIVPLVVTIVVLLIVATLSYIRKSHRRGVVRLRRSSGTDEKNDQQTEKDSKRTRRRVHVPTVMNLNELDQDQ